MDNDLIGVGVGPANLSLAALVASARDCGLISMRSTFLERNPAILWHSGQLFPGTLMQTEFYRDLVTPVDPTSKFSFLNYLKSNARLDQFFCSSTIYPTRREFEDYFNWVAKQLNDVVLSTDVTSVEYDPEATLFVVQAADGRRFESAHIVLGCGPIPDTAIARNETSRVVDVSRLLAFDFPSPLQRVLVVGGGQSAAECVNYLLDRYADAGTQITWITRDTAFRALDTGNFSRETFSASYGREFAALPEPLRDRILDGDRSVAHGITLSVAQALYQRLYALKYLRFPPDADCPSVRMHLNQEVIEIHDEGQGASVTVRALSTNELAVDVFDCVVLCTGFGDRTIFDSPIIGDRLKRRISKNDAPDGYAVAWDGPHDRKIFLQSQNQKTHGRGDANLITAPARNASILNSIAGRVIYAIDDDDKLISLS